MMRWALINQISFYMVMLVLILSCGQLNSGGHHSRWLSVQKSKDGVSYSRTKRRDERKVMRGQVLYITILTIGVIIHERNVMLQMMLYTPVDCIIISVALNMVMMIPFCLAWWP